MRCDYRTRAERRSRDILPHENKAIPHVNVKTVGLIVLLAAVVASLLFLLPSYDDQSEHSTLLLGTNVWSGYEPFYLARGLDFFDEGSVRLVECSSASQVITAFRNKTIDMAALTLDEVLLLKERGHDVQVILVTDFSHGADAILGKPGVKQLSDLRGKSIGVEHTALGAYVLIRALQTEGISVDEVNVVPLPVDEHEPAFLANEVEAVVTFEPVRSRLLAAGAVQLFDSTQIEGEIVDVLAIRPGALANNAETVDLLLRGWFKALTYLHDHPEKAAQHMLGRLKLPPSDVLASFRSMKFPDLEENIALLDGERPPLVEVADRLARIMQQEQLIQDNIDVTRLFNAAPLKRLKR